MTAVETNGKAVLEKTLLDLCKPGQSLKRLVLGLTGNPGAGKSTVARRLEELGAIVVDADAIGHALLKKDSPVYTELVRAFGRAIVNERDEIERSALGRLVFQDAVARERLNAIVHPHLLDTIQRQIDAFRNSDRLGPLIIDAALIYEWNIQDWFDGVMVVAVPEEIRHRRIMESRGKTKESVLQMERAQIDAHTKQRQADIVIDNSSGPNALYHKIEQIMKA